MAFDLKDLLNVRKLTANAPWILAGAVVGIVIYTMMNQRTGVGAIEMRSPPVYAYGPQPVVTNTYGCAGCGQTGSIGMTSGAVQQTRFY